MDTGTRPAEYWPELRYEDFAPTMKLLHMGLQMVGKLMLRKPFEPHWAHVVLGLTSSGLTSGPIPWDAGAFTVDADFGAHEIVVAPSWGSSQTFELGPMSVADWHDRFFAALSRSGIEATINQNPQEVPDGVPFGADTALRPYDRALVDVWFRALQSSAAAMRRYQACFRGDTPGIGFMWGTFDLRDLRIGRPAEPQLAAAAAGRDGGEGQVMSGWWPGGPSYPRAAYYSFIDPRPPGIDTATLEPTAARWDARLGEFLLDYDDARTAADPEATVLAFLDSAYAAGASRAGWDPALVCTARPGRMPEGVAP